jgi:hypothetical protein
MSSEDGISITYNNLCSKKYLRLSWTPEATKSFEQLKEVICKAPVLTTPDFMKTFIVEFDASRNGIGVVLMQEGRPLAFESRPLKGNDLHKPIYEKEMMAILHALKKWCP